LKGPRAAPPGRPGESLSSKKKKLREPGATDMVGCTGNPG
jgi:hypothetical protein